MARRTEGAVAPDDVTSLEETMTLEQVISAVSKDVEGFIR